jgi:sugar O-acyltransferase (sialic acid O-acetyltransferase NeuD family)
MSTLFLCGAGNSEGVRLALSIERVLHRWNRLALLDDDPAKKGLTLLGVSVVGNSGELSQAAPGEEVVNLVTRTCARRDEFGRRISAFGVPFASLIHPTVDTTGADLAAGTTVYAGATIGPEVVVDAGSVVFMGAVVGHESRVGRGCVIAANAVLNARVTLGDRVYVGSNATIVPEVTVGADSTIAAGSSVLGDVPTSVTAMGVPAEIYAPHRSTHDVRSDLDEHRDSPAHVALRQTILDSWRAILPVDRVGEDDNFFDVGGTSLLACHLAEHVRRATGHAVSLVDLFRYPTVRTLAEHIAVPEHQVGQSLAARRTDLRRQWHQRSAH